MLYTEKTLKTLEFDKIREMLASIALTEGAKELSLKLTPINDTEEIVNRLRKVEDAKRLMNSKGMPPFGDIKNMNDICDRVEKGAILTARELLDVANVLRTSRSLLEYIKVNKLFSTVLDEIFDRMLPNKSVENSIYSSIISEELIADDASTTLSDIRRKIRMAHSRIKDVLQKYVVNSSYSKYLQENIVTTRNGRYVVPVKAECRGEVKGLVHDTSSSGATLFVEPIAVVDANNELRVLESKEEKEIEKILATLSSKVAEISSEIYLNYNNITELSFVFACAELSFRMRANAPKISDNSNREIVLHGARHPLIDKDKVVPTDIEIGNGYDTMIITGPNTGGKTVTLKTIGLFSLMAQSGLHIPANEDSCICVFDNILVDIGDEQSIEQSLSTFSSHMVNIVSIMNQLTDNSLVLFDELGVGTDPVEGAALAVSIIESVRKAGAICAATTHYAELKIYALDTDGVINASCEFDVETLKPTYKLVIGTPGRSNAFAISTKLGLQSNIVERANELVSSDNRRFEDVIEKLDESRIKMENDRLATMQMREDYERFKKESEKIIKEKLALADKELENAKIKAVGLVESAKLSSDYVLNQLEEIRKKKESERFGDELEKARRDIKKHLRDNENKYNPVDEKTNENYVLPRKLRKGDNVFIVNIGKNGVLIDDPDKNGNVNVRAGIISTRTKIKNLRLVEDEINIISKDNTKNKASDYKVQVSRDFKDEIDLRGMTGDEAWLAVDKYLDEAIIVGIKTVHLIHGKGTGALKNAIWNFIKADKRISSFRIGRYGEGDGGVTVVELK